MARSAYVHIPFCARKCDFCDFAVAVGLDSRMEDYRDALVAEIANRLAAEPNGERLETVYFGGGTPGYYPAHLLADIYKTLVSATGIEPFAEVTIETTPQAVTERKAGEWLEIGVNRISIGVESLSDEELERAGRHETAASAAAAVLAARQAGFANICCDIMYGLPGQTCASLESTIAGVAALDVEHVSAYGLTLSANSPLYSRIPRGSDQYPDEELFCAMYEVLVDRLQSHGYRQYEISNFARPGWESRHNLAYWRNREYLGFGLSAHRYTSGVRSASYRSFARYMRAPDQDEIREPIDAGLAAREGIFLGLRTTAGVDFAEFETEHHLDIRARYASEIERLVEAGFLELSASGMRLTRRGILVSNLVMTEFM